jgi:iron complex outermembrane recepter protein
MALSIRSHHRPVALAAALAFAGVIAAQAQDAQRVIVTAPAQAPSVSGFGDVPLWRAPLQATYLGSEPMKDRGTTRLADLTSFDASVSDAYNSEGYIDYLTVRGFIIDNRYNYRRDGLPINAETSLPLGNKDRVELLKGTSGMQAGTSAPGGLVNVIVKRPGGEALQRFGIEWREQGTLAASVDLSQRFGDARAFGLRLNAEAEHLAPLTHALQGERRLFALAGDWRVSPDTLLEAEIETSHRRQPSVPGFSLLGDRLPDARRIDPRINLNNQPWSLPNVFDGDTASLRVNHRLNERWQLSVHGATQRLRTDDRAAFPFGCSAENPDFIPPFRYCSDGTFDLYDFRSENERRRSDALDISVQGRTVVAGMEHSLAGGVLSTRFASRLQGQAYNRTLDANGDPNGIGNIEGRLVVGAAPDAALTNTNRSERSTELYLRDAVALNAHWHAWFGLRRTHLSRQSVQTDGSDPTSFGQSFTTPWLALSHEFAPQQMVYASWGQGVQSNVTPNLAGVYDNPGKVLPAQKSRQFELGVKGRADPLEWSGTWFDIVQPAITDMAPAYFIDGSERHHGVEAQLAWRSGAWLWRASGMWLKAERRDAQDSTLDNLRPTNVPARSLRIDADYRLSMLPGLILQARLSHEGDRMVLPDNSVRVPSWTRVDTGARLEHRTSWGMLTWRAGVDNLFDRRAWKESPFQYGHAYLFPLAPRSLRLSLQADL